MQAALTSGGPSVRAIASLAPASVISRLLQRGTPEAPPFGYAPGRIETDRDTRNDRRMTIDRRQLLTSVPPAEERRLFDRRSADRKWQQSSRDATTGRVRKGLLVDVYV